VEEDSDREVETMIEMIGVIEIKVTLVEEDLEEEARIEGGLREEEILEAKEDIESIRGKIIKD
jgi:hypothetical protein